jgi:hypothetical protein
MEGTEPRTAAWAARGIAQSLPLKPAKCILAATNAAAYLARSAASLSHSADMHIGEGASIHSPPHGLPGPRQLREADQTRIKVGITIRLGKGG